jgi:hypothetical protein
MNLIELTQQFFGLGFPLILIGLFILILKIFNSYHLIPDPLIETIQFRKGNTTYRNPPRPNSSTFDKYLYLALMTTPDYQRQLLITIADLIKKNIEHQPQEVRIKLSENLILLVDHPDLWLQQEYEKIKTFKRKEKEKHLHAEIYRILTEVEEKIGVKILSEKEIL